MGTILVTGATSSFGKLFTGWLKSHSSDSIERSGLRTLDEPGYWPCDLGDVGATRRLVAETRPDLIYHMAGSSTNDFERDFRVNSLAARNLIAAVLEEKLRTKVVLIGSAAEYGAVDPGENPITEEQPLRPVSVYGLTKAFQTQFGLSYARQGDVEVVVARMFNLVAPGLSERLFVGRVERQILAYKSGESSEIVVGNLDAERDYVDVSEAVRQLDAIGRMGVSGEVYHIGSGRPTRMSDLLRRMLQDADVPYEAVVADPKLSNRAGFDVPIIFADMSKTNALQYPKIDD